jgi:hypothetical protein
LKINPNNQNKLLLKKTNPQSPRRNKRTTNPRLSISTARNLPHNTPPSKTNPQSPIRNKRTTIPRLSASTARNLPHNTTPSKTNPQSPR